METPVLAVIDLQKDFYHPNGVYGQHNRPLGPIQKLVRNLSPIVSQCSAVLRIQSIYRKGQFDDMPNLCLAGSKGTKWHPDLEKGPLLTKHQHSGFPALNKFLDAPVPVILAGVCTHRCVKATFDGLTEQGWPTWILDGGVAACGLRQTEHSRWMDRWRQRGKILEPSELHEGTDWNCLRKSDILEFNDSSQRLQAPSRRPM